MESTVVDDPIQLAKILDTLTDLPVVPPSLYLDLEGEHLCRHGTISILELFVLPARHVYLIDVFSLGGKAFSTPSATSGRTLKDMLESSEVPKAFFDVRNDSDALFSHFQIRLAGVHDVQLMELAARTTDRTRLNGLTQCIAKDAGLPPQQVLVCNAVKARGLELFEPKHGGDYRVFNVRPIPDEIRAYCVQDVAFLPALWAHYHGRLSGGWKAKVEAETRARVAESHTEAYVPKGPNKAFGPWGRGGRNTRGGRARGWGRGRGRDRGRGGGGGGGTAGHGGGRGSVGVET